MASNKYEAERFVPSLAQCSTLSLHFNGSTLRMTGGKQEYSHPAVSGMKARDGSFSYTPERQRLSFAGPIPEGKYWINPAEIWELEWYNFWTNEDGWGKIRVTIHPFSTTATGGRGGFFIHGGKIPGNSGCIDLTSKITAFVKDLDREGARRKCHIPLAVEYPAEVK